MLTFREAMTRLDLAGTYRLGTGDLEPAFPGDFLRHPAWRSVDDLPAWVIFCEDETPPQNGQQVGLLIFPDRISQWVKYPSPEGRGL